MRTTTETTVCSVREGGEVHVTVLLALVTLLNMFFGVLLHRRPIVPRSQGFPRQGLTAHVLGVNPFVYLPQYLGDCGFVDAL